MEDTLVPKAGYPVEHIKLAGFYRGFTPSDIVHNVKTVSYLMTADHKARRILKDFKPDAVIGTRRLSLRPHRHGSAEAPYPHISA